MNKTGGMFFKKRSKIFCISFQRTGTTSVGQFFKAHGYSVATWDISRKNQWTKLWFDGNYEKIFSSEDFIANEVFEDDPWWCLDFYKVLYHRFPYAKFILVTRESDAWFNSMLSHSQGRTLGNTYRHSKLYRREKEFYNTVGNTYNYKSDTIDNLLPLNETHRNHYKEIYELRNKEIIDFFNRHESSRLIPLRLEDNDKWKKLGSSFNIYVSDSFEIHVNASKKI